MEKIGGLEHRRELIEAALAEASPQQMERIERSMAVARPIIEELVRAGYEVESLDELRHLGRPWKTALPILLPWLSKIDDPDIKEAIVRCLSVPWIGNKATAKLIEEFQNSVTDKPMLAWAIGNALSIVDVSGFEVQILALSRNPAYGMARQMLVSGLGRLRNDDAEAVAIELLNDDSVKLHAIAALRAMKSRRALPALERLSTDKKAVIRKEARQAIRKIAH